MQVSRYEFDKSRKIAVRGDALRAWDYPTPTGDGGAITVRLSNFAFGPEDLRLKAGAPVRLRIVNDSDTGHNFSAPAFFAASGLLAGSSIPLNGAVEVEATSNGGGSARLDVRPETGGDPSHGMQVIEGCTG